MTRLYICFAAFILICSCLLPLSTPAQTIDFSGRKFKEPVNIEFWKRNLQPGIEIDSTSTRFPKVIFHQPINFNSATFDARASFGWATFDSTAYFYEATFKDWANFLLATFEDTADFSRATFDSTAYFAKVTFGATADFSWATFEETANFRGAHFKDNVSFFAATLPKQLDFRGVTEIAKEINFTWAEPPCVTCKCQIVLVDADISKIKLNMRLFELWFPDDPTYDKRCSVYEQVLKKLENDGFMESYEILDIEYRQFKARHKGGLSWYVADIFHDW